jgi:TetR/AcrR family transcriptional regulator
VEFARAGYSGARIERIASAARVNKQLLFHYFASKGGLFLAALEAMLLRIEPAHSGSDNPSDELRAVIAALQEAARRVPTLAGVLAGARDQDALPAAASAMLSAWRARQLARLETALEDGQRRGYYRDDVDVSSIARIGFAAALGAGALDGNGPQLPLGAFLVDCCGWR